MFPCVVSDQIESKEGKHSLLQTTCNRFFLRPNKSSPCFRSCDTFRCFVLFPTYPVSGPPPPPLHPTLTRMHVQSFPFPVRQITWTGNGGLQRYMLRQENRKASSRVSNKMSGETRSSWRTSIHRRQGSKKRVIIAPFGLLFPSHAKYKLTVVENSHRQYFTVTYFS